MTLLSDHLPKGVAVLDASVIINLLGCGDPVRVLTALAYPCLVEARTIREVLRHPISGLSVEDILFELMNRKLLDTVRMTEEEYEVYLGYVEGPLEARLDDGESSVLAIAGRGACIILDERKARRRAGADLPNVVVGSTLQLMLTSAYRAGWPEAQVRELVQNAVQHARMGVPREDSDLLRTLIPVVSSDPK